MELLGGVKQTHRAVEGVLWEGDVMIGHYTRDPASVLGSPQDAVEVREILEDVVTFFSPVAQRPVPHLRALRDKKD